MKKVTKKEKIEVQTDYFVADDGVAFQDEEECEAYERQQDVDKRMERLKPFLTDICYAPPFWDGCPDFWGFTWLKLTSGKDFTAISKVLEGGMPKRPKSYPDYICVASQDGEDGVINFDYYDTYLLSEMIKETQAFFKDFGVNLMHIRNFDNK